MRERKEEKERRSKKKCVCEKERERERERGRDGHEGIDERKQVNKNSDSKDNLYDTFTHLNTQRIWGGWGRRRGRDDKNQ